MTAGTKCLVLEKKNRKALVETSRVDGVLGGADPFGAFSLPQNSTTDMALHHCKADYLRYDIGLTF